MFSELISIHKTKLLTLAKELLIFGNTSTLKNYTDLDLKNLNTDLRAINSPILLDEHNISIDYHIKDIPQVKNNVIVNLQKKYQTDSSEIFLLKFILNNPGSTILEASEETFFSVSYLYVLKNKINKTKVFQENGLSIQLDGRKLHLSGTPIKKIFFIYYFSKKVMYSSTSEFEELIDKNIPESFHLDEYPHITDLTKIVFPNLSDKRIVANVFLSHYNPNISKKERDAIGNLLTSRPNCLFVSLSDQLISFMKKYYPQVKDTHNTHYIYEFFILFVFFTLQESNFKYYPPSDYFYFDISNPTLPDLSEHYFYQEFLKTFYKKIPDEFHELSLKFIEYLIPFLDSTRPQPSTNIFISLQENDFSIYLLSNIIQTHIDNDRINFVTNHNEADLIITNNFSTFNIDFPKDDIYYFQNFIKEIDSKQFLQFIIGKMVLPKKNYHN